MATLSVAVFVGSLREASINRRLALAVQRLAPDDLRFEFIALDGLPPAAPGARLTKNDVREIVAYARTRHIDVVPCLELYGHLHDLFRREQYSGLADFPHGVEFNPADPKVQALIANWVQQYTELFPSPFVHVGFDETWQLQQAAAKGAGAPAAIFLGKNYLGQKDESTTNLNVTKDVKKMSEEQLLEIAARGAGKRDEKSEPTKH